MTNWRCGPCTRNSTIRLYTNQEGMSNGSKDDDEETISKLPKSNKKPRRQKKRLEGKGWTYLNSYVANLIAHDNRYALTGKQVKELLDLAN